MIEKLAFGALGRATFACPRCRRSKTVNISKYRHVKQAVHVTCKCKCGQVFKSLVERRRERRMNTDLKGVFVRCNNGKVIEHGEVNVIDISPGGICFQMKPGVLFQTSDQLIIVCQNAAQSPKLIKESAVVRHADQAILGAEFCESDGAGRSLEFLLYG